MNIQTRSKERGQKMGHFCRRRPFRIVMIGSILAVGFLLVFSGERRADSVGQLKPAMNRYSTHTSFAARLDELTVPLADQLFRRPVFRTAKEQPSIKETPSFIPTSRLDQTQPSEFLSTEHRRQRTEFKTRSHLDLLIPAAVSTPISTKDHASRLQSNEVPRTPAHNHAAWTGVSHPVYGNDQTSPTVSHPQNQPDEFGGVVSPSISEEDEILRVVSHPPYVVPNIVHFIWFVPHVDVPFTFLNYISAFSAHLHHKPEMIVLHCNFIPAGKWWKRLERKVSMKIVHVHPPRFIFGQRVGNIFHSSDITKFEIILKYGGIYLDLDVIVVNSLDPLRLFNATMGRERPPKLIAGIVIGARGSEFFRLVYESYRNNYYPKDWDYNCARVPYLIYLNNSHLLHVETRKLTTPDFTERHLLLDRTINWRDLYVVHVMAHLLPPTALELENVRRMKSTLGEVIRYVHYGSPMARRGSERREERRMR